ncbi:hypothetical protein EDB85DRAFT_623996 [Lactarius pseudohatsudake]|nr:hypothetical protein EDB85DRAFT_623996 [Lactarius pseudohatsudake]
MTWSRIHVLLFFSPLKGGTSNLRSLPFGAASVSPGPRGSGVSRSESHDGYIRYLGLSDRCNLCPWGELNRQPCAGLHKPCGAGGGASWRYAPLLHLPPPKGKTHMQLVLPKSGPELRSERERPNRTATFSSGSGSGSALLPPVRFPVQE